MSEEFIQTIEQALPTVADEFGSGAVSLYALTKRAEEQPRYQAIVTAIVQDETAGSPKHRTLLIYEFAFRIDRWRLVELLVGEDPLLSGLAVWLGGECADCFGHWERWQGATK
ncbi:MAG: hypothetical protein WD379_03705 [Dehalococcoidia bacterium]